MTHSRRLLPSAVRGLVWLTVCTWVAAPLEVGCARRVVPEDAPRVLRAIELLRDASNAEKAPRLRALEAEPCTLADVCALQKLCVEAYASHVRALESQRAVRHGLSAGSDPARLRKLLEQAEDELGRARDAAQHCATEEGRLRALYRI